MEKFVIDGGNRIYGRIKNERAKNSVLPILAASILTEEKVTILDCPRISDVYTMIEILEYLGVKCTFSEGHLTLDSSNIYFKPLPYKLTKKLRSSVFLLGAMLSKFRRAELAYPGGCNIGLRPVDIHIDGLKKMGVICNEDCQGVWCSIDKLKGGHIHLSFPSVGATENIMTACAISDVTTYIHNPAKEPEIVDLMNFINQLGGKISGAGTDLIEIKGVKKLHGACYKPIADRIEFGTYLLAVGICGGELEIFDCNFENILPLREKFCDNACKITINSDIIHISCNKLRNPFSFTTGPYPMFPTDLQAQTMALCCTSEGTSIIQENVFENRFKHISEFKKMGADVSVCGRVATVRGVKSLHGASVSASDLRGGASLVLAGLGAEGQTTIKNIWHIDRGYADMDGKLRSLGIKIKRI